jgi:phosphocarrier protein HPr
MLEATVRVTNTLGLHARAAAQLVRLANRFKSEIVLTRTDTGVSANAKSILSVLNLPAALGAELRISANGDDESDAVTGITRLFTSNFGEE